jgi:hypothetical protein
MWLMEKNMLKMSVHQTAVLALTVMIFYFEIINLITLFNCWSYLRYKEKQKQKGQWTNA